MPASSAVWRSLAWCRGPPAISAKFRCAVQQELRELVGAAAGAGDVAGDGRGDAVSVFGRALAVPAQDHGPPVGGESAVTAGGVAAGEVAEQDQIGRS
ncbi:hypothetical protein ABZ464_51625 [Streptomyces sp. NPDC005820]|uniref:hypothetical protein n=1 Tax=Streptomyces sp. NPDC005820 TaxID=3157069 RepID=UPI00340844AC